jgi:hypothetical protein
MPTFYIDETGFTGEDLMSVDQPIFVQATNNYSADEVAALLRHAFSGINAAELKYKQLVRGGRHEDRVLECIKAIANDPERSGTWIAHKEFAMVTFIVDWWMEPLAYQAGHNLYQDGANLSTANMLFLTLAGFWDVEFRRRLLLHFQRMFRSRSVERFNECEAFVRKALSKVRGDRRDVLSLLWPSFGLLGIDHVVKLPKHVLDLSLPGLAAIGHRWRSRHEGPWEVVYDRSSMMAKQAWLWEKLSSPHLSSASFDGPGGEHVFPMNVTATRFGDSQHEMQIQICDVVAGATASCSRAFAEGRLTRYAEKLVEAGIEKLNLGSIWPSDQVTAEGIGRKGWDGNKAIEWIETELARNRLAHHLKK